MKQSTRFILAIALILAITALVLGVTYFQRQSAQLPAPAATPLPAGSLPIYMNGVLIAGFVPSDLENLPLLQFTDSIEGKVQDGWLLRDILMLHVPAGQLTPQTRIIVTSQSRGKSATLTWAEVQDPANFVMFDLSNRGTLKLASVLPALDEREEWVQDSDRIDIQTP